MVDTPSLPDRRVLPELTCVCCNCQRERTDADADRWQEHTPRPGERLTHGICPECLFELYPDLAPLVRGR